MTGCEGTGPVSSRKRGRTKNKVLDGVPGIKSSRPVPTSEVSVPTHHGSVRPKCTWGPKLTVCDTKMCTLGRRTRPEVLTDLYSLSSAVLTTVQRRLSRPAVARDSTLKRLPRLHRLSTTQFKVFSTQTPGSQKTLGQIVVLTSTDPSSSRDGTSTCFLDSRGKVEGSSVSVRVPDWCVVQVTEVVQPQGPPCERSGQGDGLGEEVNRSLRTPSQGLRVCVVLSAPLRRDAGGPGPSRSETSSRDHHPDRSRRKDVMTEDLKRRTDDPRSNNLNKRGGAIPESGRDTPERKR